LARRVAAICLLPSGVPMATDFPSFPKAFFLFWLGGGTINVDCLFPFQIHSIQILPYICPHFVPHNTPKAPSPHFVIMLSPSLRQHSAIDCPQKTKLIPPPRCPEKGSHSSALHGWQHSPVGSNIEQTEWRKEGEGANK
jgi:hypothetical protein